MLPVAFYVQESNLLLLKKFTGKDLPSYIMALKTKNNNNKQATKQTKPVSVKFSKYFVQENFKKNKLSSFICVQTKSFQTRWALFFLYIHPIVTKLGFCKKMSLFYFFTFL